MLQGVCVETGQTTTLVEGMQYYLFPKGQKHYLVSKFPNENAHMGCYGSEYFQLVEKEIWPEEPTVKDISLDPERMYKARLIWRREGYKDAELKEYFLRPKMSHAYFYLDEQLERFCGCFPLHWFSDFEEIEVEPINEEIELEFTESDHFSTECVLKEVVFEQLSLF
ncbi:hypothetical protein [Bacillus sp. ISL-45]|uniref:hypothetical protein n=1 Tax=Bacillus sp. ISL-45 TaxID=2819128 RepID=UPI001BE8926F|nr:hypothetical protein [Bacillus sp. ISL-45]MBT2661923.1 hypothetical protein [Bacillus sp. ISL-45]